MQTFTTVSLKLQLLVQVNFDINEAGWDPVHFLILFI